MQINLGNLIFEPGKRCGQRRNFTRKAGGFMAQGKGGSLQCQAAIQKRLLGGKFLFDQGVLQMQGLTLGFDPDMLRADLVDSP